MAFGGDGSMTDASDELTAADYASLAAFRRALRRFANFSTAAAQKAGLTTHQHQALLAIKGAAEVGPLAIGELADELQVAPHSAAELVSRLVAAGLVEKRGDPGDRRRIGLVLTAKAEAALQALTLVHKREVRILAPRLMAIFRDLDGGTL